MTYIFLILLIVFDLHKFEVAKNDTEVALYWFNLPKLKPNQKNRIFTKAKFQHICIFLSRVFNPKNLVSFLYHYVETFLTNDALGW